MASAELDSGQPLADARKKAASRPFVADFFHKKCCWKDVGRWGREVVNWTVMMMIAALDFLRLHGRNQNGILWMYSELVSWVEYARIGGPCGVGQSH